MPSPRRRIPTGTLSQKKRLARTPDTAILLFEKKRIFEEYASSGSAHPWAPLFLGSPPVFAPHNMSALSIFATRSKEAIFLPVHGVFKCMKPFSRPAYETRFIRAISAHRTRGETWGSSIRTKMPRTRRLKEAPPTRSHKKTAAPRCGSSASMPRGSLFTEKSHGWAKEVIQRFIEKMYVSYSSQFSAVR